MNGNNEYLRIARITGAHSLKGALKIQLHTDNPERFSPGEVIFLEIGGSFTRYQIEGFNLNPGSNSILKLEGLNNRTDAEQLKGIEIFITREQAEATRNLLGDDSFYYYDLIDCEVMINGKLFGRVLDLMEAGSGQILIVKGIQGRRFMIPFVKEIVNTDLINSRRLIVTPPEGLLEV